MRHIPPPPNMKQRNQQQHIPQQQQIDPLELVVKTLIQFNKKKVAKDVVRAFGEQATTIDQLDNIGRLAFEIKDYPTSVTACTTVLNTLLSSKVDQQQIYSARSNLVIALSHNNQPEEALQIIAEQEAIMPNDNDRLLKKAFCLFLMARRDEAEVILRAQLDSPTVPEKIKTEVQFNLGTYDLYNGDFQGGLSRFLKYGPLFNNWKRYQYPYPRWDGSIKENAIIAVVAEAGIGDEFINVRFMNNLKELGMQPIWITGREDLSRIFSSNGYTSVTSMDKLLDKPDYWCYSMDLPVLLNLQPEDLWHGPYLKPDEFHIDNVSDIFQDNDGLRIGIRWQGNPDYDQDLHRSISYNDMISTINDALVANKPDGYTIYSLQRDDGVNEIDDKVVDLSKDMDTFEDTLAIINNLDIVITSCTSIAHASAALGKQTIVLVPISAYYVWCHPTEQSPWYGDNVTIIRQTKPNSWKEALQLLREILSKI